MSKNAKVRAVAVWALLATLFVATTGCTITVDPDAAAPARYRESVKVTPAAAKLVGFIGDSGHVDLPCCNP